MQKNVKRIICLLFAVFVMALSFPFEVFAVDPVSSAAIANAFAQAITAYGASNGVSFIFDDINSNNTAQIGETIHELWKDFRAGQQTVDDYETIAAAIFPGLYSKAMNAAGNAVVAIHIADTYLPDIDDFWNFVLSGPAHMVEVDNAFQWTVDPVTNEIEKINIYPGMAVKSVPYLPYVVSNTDNNVIRQNAFKVASKNNDEMVSYIWTDNVSETYLYTYKLSNYNDRVYIVALSSALPESRTFYNRNINSSNGSSGGAFSYDGSVGQTVHFYRNIGTMTDFYVPAYSSHNDAASALLNLLGQELHIGVAPYVGDAVAKPVPIPDTSDPDYGPLPYIGNLPIPWNDTLFGDGTGTLTDEQSGAITDAIDDAIVANPDKTMELEDEATDDPDKPTTDDPPSNDPDDYAVPGLQTIFPFCIPFDVYNFLSALAAEPTAPHFTATLQFPAAIGGPQTIDIDFNNQTFNTLAGILRTLELLAFIVGLALLTRSMFIRG